jgi:hypothetical protein
MCEESPESYQVIYLDLYWKYFTNRFYLLKHIVDLILQIGSSLPIKLMHLPSFKMSKLIKKDMLYILTLLSRASMLDIWKIVNVGSMKGCSYFYIK